MAQHHPEPENPKTDRRPVRFAASEDRPCRYEVLRSVLESGSCAADCVEAVVDRLRTEPRP